MPKSKPIRDLKLLLKQVDGDWLVTGKKTYNYRQQLKEGGGEWNKELGGWIFPSNPEELVETVNNQIQADEERLHRERQERGRQLSKAKAQLAEKRKRIAAEKEEFKKLLADPSSREEIERVTKEMIARKTNGSFWPLNETSTDCFCGIHIFWKLYLLADKDIDKAAASYDMSCPQCGFDFTK